LISDVFFHKKLSQNFWAAIWASVSNFLLAQKNFRHWNPEIKVEPTIKLAKEKRQTMIYKTLHRKQKIDQHNNNHG
jgi:hypothetical protein